MKSIYFLTFLTFTVILLSLPEIRGQSTLQYVINSTGSVYTKGAPDSTVKYIEYSVGEFYTFDGKSSRTIAGICQPSNIILNALPSVFDEYFKITVYPNPVQSFLLIETDYTRFKKTRIINELGQIILETHFEKTINVSELPTGTFLIQFVTDETQFTKTIKIIKQ